jgi:hypothetical protein
LHHDGFLIDAVFGIIKLLKPYASNPERLTTKAYLTEPFLSEEFFYRELYTTRGMDKSRVDGETGTLTPNVVELSRNGNPVALAPYLERLIPSPKDRPINFSVPKVEGRQG